MQTLSLSVHFMNGRYHGEPEWPPSPARLFQALIAGSGFSDVTNTPLHWLEQLPPPTVIAPLAVRGQEMGHFVPNNDLDSEGADPKKIGDIRVQKTWHPRIFNADVPVLYTWQIDKTEQAQARRVIELAHNLYQLGRGIDMAWATGAILEQEALDELLENHPGETLRPTKGARGGELSCPRPGSLDSLERRYDETLQRFSYVGEGKSRTQIFRQPAKALFAEVSYNSAPQRKLYDLRCTTAQSQFSPMPLSDIAIFATSLRDAAAAKLTGALPQHKIDIERGLLGKKQDSAPAVAASERVRLIPLPSIGHEHVGREIRRLLIEVPASCSLRSGDVFWAFDGLEHGEILLIEADDSKMLKHYGVNGDEAAAKNKLWRTVTPAALPLKAARRRIDPQRRHKEAKNGKERLAEEARARGAVKQALRHANIDAQIEDIWVQREPFAAKEKRVEPFAKGTRFAKEQLWHVEVAFREQIAGPMVIGNGRFMGLGLMAPVAESSKQPSAQIFAFRVLNGLSKNTDVAELVRAFRRAVMSRFSQASKSKHLPAFISGHESDGSPVKGENRQVSFVFDGTQLMVVPPHIRAKQSLWGSELHHLRLLESAMADFVELRAGSQGKLSLEPTLLDSDELLLATAKTWTSKTPYAVNRHQKRSTANEVFKDDLEASCLSAGLPKPEIEVLKVQGIRNKGLQGLATLRFKTAVSGPLLLGRTRHLGGGLFLPSQPV